MSTYVWMQVLYQELRKMRGMGEELDMLQQAQRDVVAARYRGRVYRGGAEEDEGHGGGAGQ